jgi:hypothetical protein
LCQIFLDVFSTRRDNVNMRKPNVKTKMLLGKAVRLEQLPHRIPRAVAADFLVISTRTLLRAEKAGKLRPYKYGQSWAYDRAEFLRYCGIEE